SGNVGAKGPGGLAGANPGTAGGNTTFITTAVSPVTYTAGGGPGGAAGSAFTPPLFQGATSGRTCTNGDVQEPGAPSLAALSMGVVSSGTATSLGGASHYGFPDATSLVGGPNSSVAGSAGTGKGAGGGGAAANGTGSAAAGGDGTDGIVI